MPPARSSFTESVVEEAAFAWLAELGYTILHEPDIAIGEPAAERRDPNCRDAVLKAASARRWLG